MRATDHKVRNANWQRHFTALLDPCRLLSLNTMRRQTPRPHQHIVWTVQDFQARELGRQPPEPQLNGILCPVQVVQVQVCQSWQRRQRPQVARNDALFID
jgi:hypothetical protein